MRMKPIALLLLPLIVAVMVGTQPVRGQHSAPKTPAKHTSAMTFSKAAATWAEVLADKQALNKAVAGGKWAEVHERVFAIRDGVVTLPYKSAALPAATKKKLEAQVMRVASLAEDMDKAADAGKGAETRAKHKQLTAALATIEGLYPPNTLPTTGARPMSSAERALFLTPGGLYTAADIKANGNTSVYQKHPDFVASHDAGVKKGERVCPISETKPDPKLTWIVGGKTYSFCCPPCVAEFVGKAKTAPKSIKAPEAYVKK